MHLWTDYEGNTLDGKFRLEKLFRSEGRNAFFSSTDPSGALITIRLTEALNDESELIARWEKVAELKQENLLRIASAGKTVVDGVPLAYLLIEPADAVLADVLSDRALTKAEALDVAAALTDALETLHAAGLIHEHISAENVMAVGETVKLRTDCVRECVGDFENDTEESRAALRARDVHDLGQLFYRCLTLQREPPERIAPGTLPAPFDRIVPNALSGAWDLKSVVGALPVKLPPPAPVTTAPVVAPVAAAVTTAAAPAPTVNAASQIDLPLKPQAAAPRPTVSVPSVKSGFRPRAGKGFAPEWQPQAVPVSAPPVATRADVHLDAYPGSRDVPYEAGIADMDAHRATLEQELVTRLHGMTESRVFAGVGSNLGAKMEQPAFRYGLGAAAVVLLGLMIHHWSDTAPEAHAAKQVAVVAPARPTAAPAPAAAMTAGSLLTAARAQPGWHVIAYTYNHEEQARAKVMALQRQHFSLQPQVFTPTGGAPYFVALGSATGEDQAVNVRSKARRAGLPRDIYIRNF